jgi:hypothetical protein
VLEPFGLAAATCASLLGRQVTAAFAGGLHPRPEAHQFNFRDSGLNRPGRWGWFGPVVWMATPAPCTDPPPSSVQPVQNWGGAMFQRRGRACPHPAGMAESVVALQSMERFMPASGLAHANRDPANRSPGRGPRGCRFHWCVAWSR